MTCATDIFSFGVTLFFCATGAFPYCENDADEISICYLVSKGKDPAKKLQISEPGTSPILRDGVAMVVAKALKKPVEERYAQAEAMLHDVRDSIQYVVWWW